MAAKTMTNVEAFYIKSHLGKKSAAEMAQELGCTPRSVQKFIDSLPPEPEKKVEPTDPKIGSFAVQASGEDKKGPLSVSMTKAQSEIGDEVAKKAGALNKDFFDSRAKNAIHVIRPDEPIR